MPRKIQLVSVGALMAVTVVLGVRLFQTTRRLDKAEQYMMSGMVSWVGACGAVAGDLVSDERSEVRRAANFVRSHCVSEADWPASEALLAKGAASEAHTFVNHRLYEHHLPRILERRSYDRSSFPVGYP